MSFDTNYSELCNYLYQCNKGSRHADIFPKNVFAIIAGSTGCGKTNLMLNLLLNGYLNYNKVMIYTTTPYQPVYRYLKDCDRYNIVSFHNPTDGIADPSNLDKSKAHVIIFDDVMSENQKVMTDYFCRGRHNNASVFYLCQSLHQLKKHGIRQNANMFILFHQDKKTLKYFHETHISGDMPFVEFKQLRDNAWSQKHGYIVINLWEESFCRFLINYKKVYIPQKFSNNVSKPL